MASQVSNELQYDPSSAENIYVSTIRHLVDQELIGKIESSLNDQWVKTFLRHFSDLIKVSRTAEPAISSE